MTAKEGMRIIEHRHLTAPEAYELVHALFEKEDEARVYRSYYEKAGGLREKLAAAEPWRCDDCCLINMSEEESNAHHASTGHSVFRQVPTQREQEVDSDVDSLGDLHGILHAEEEADAGKLREAEERIDKSLLSKVVGVIVNERLKVRRLSAEGLAKSILAVIFPEGTEDPPSSWPTNEAESADLEKELKAEREGREAYNRSAMERAQKAERERDMAVQGRADFREALRKEREEAGKLREVATEAVRILRHLGAGSWERNKAANALEAALHAPEGEKA